MLAGLIAKTWTRRVAAQTNIYFTTMEAEGEGWDPVKLA